MTTDRAADVLYNSEAALRLVASELDALRRPHARGDAWRFGEDSASAVMDDAPSGDGQDTSGQHAA